MPPVKADRRDTPAVAGQANTTPNRASEAQEVLTVQEVCHETALWALESEWNKLLARSDSNLLFVTHAWITSWWRHIGRPRYLQGRTELFVLTVRRRAQLCGVAPLMLDVERFFGVSTRMIRFLGHGVSDYADFIVAADRQIILAAIGQHLSKRSALWDVIDLREFYGTSANIPPLQAMFQTSGFVVRTRYDSVCPYTPIEGPWDSFYGKQFSGQRRRRHGREWRSLQVAHQPTVRFVTDLADNPADVLDSMAAVERHHPTAHAGQARFLNLNVYRGFFEEVIAQAARFGWLSLALLTCDGRLAAYYLSFRYNGRYYLYTTSYRRTLSKLSVGRLLMLRMLEHYWTSADTEIDFLRGDERYKSDWATQTRHNMRFVVVHRAWRSRVRGWLGFVCFPILQRRLPRLCGLLSFVGENSWKQVIWWMWRRLPRPVFSRRTTPSQKETPPS